MVNQKLGLNYSSHKDHSKLAIAANNSKPWVCIGDINREVSTCFFVNETAFVKTIFIT